MSRYLFVLWDGGGNVPPMLRIGEQLVAAGHDVTVLTHPALVARLPQGAIRTRAFVRGPDHDARAPGTDVVKAWDATDAQDAFARARERMLFGPALAIAQDTRDAIDACRPDVVASDYVVFGGLVAGEAARLPTVVLVPHVYPLPHRAARGRGPFTLLFSRLIEGGLDTLNEARQQLGLDSLRAVSEQYMRAERMILTTYRAFDAPGVDVPGHVEYVGPQLPIPRQPAAAAAPSTPDAPPTPHYSPLIEVPTLLNELSPKCESTSANPAPLIIVTFSTAFLAQASVVRTILDVVAGLPVTALLLTGPALASEPWPAAPNITVREFVPHAEVLPRASLVITHAGHGSVMGPLLHGVPLLCLPFAQDQFDLARRVVELGAGLELRRDSTPHAVRDAIERLLRDETFRANARRVRETFLREDTPRRAVDVLEAVAARARVRHARSR